jgi:hypothetical protein
MFMQSPQAPAARASTGKLIERWKNMVNAGYHLSNGEDLRAGRESF